MRTHRLVGLALAVLALPLLARGDDWPQWNGPDRTGISKEKGLLAKWPEKGPDLAWTFSDAGTGFSAPAVVGNHIYILGARKDDEYVIALDAAKGTELWAAKIGPVFDFKENQWSRGPNTTPSVDGNFLFAIGSQGDVVCVDVTKKGKNAVVWQKSLPKDFGGALFDIPGGDPQLGWGYSGSPLVDGNQVICTPGGPKGLLLALNKKTGETVWQSKDVPELATYSSPIVAEVGGVRQYIAMTQDGAVGVDTKTGDQLWRYKRPNKYGDIVAPTPIYYKDHVFLTSWKTGPDLIELTTAGKKFAATKVYAKNTLANMHGGVVLVDGYVYGSHVDRGWKCLEFATGKEMWTTGDLGFGSVTFADGNLYCLTQETGEVALVEASPKAFNEISRFTLPKTSKLRKPSGRVWTYPVVANGCLYLRDQELLFCYKLK